MPTGPLPTIIVDSVTHLGVAHRGAVVHAASHGGLYAAAYAAGNRPKCDSETLASRKK